MAEFAGPLSNKWLDCQNCMKAKRRVARAQGRPREFDMNQALDRALDVFWRQGYEGSSLTDLTKAMGVNRPSMYAAFGSKESLFRKALDRYEEGPASFVGKALRQPTAGAAIRMIFQQSIELLTNHNHPKGCLWVHGALACSRDSEGIRQELIARRFAGLDAIKNRFRRAKKEGEFPAYVDADALAEFYVTILNGMSVQASSGASKRTLARVAEAAMRVWPENA